MSGMQDRFRPHPASQFGLHLGCLEGIRLIEAPAKRKMLSLALAVGMPRPYLKRLKYSGMRMHSAFNCAGPSNSGAKVSVVTLLSPKARPDDNEQAILAHCVAFHPTVTFY